MQPRAAKDDVLSDKWVAQPAARYGPSKFMHASSNLEALAEAGVPHILGVETLGGALPCALTLPSKGRFLPPIVWLAPGAGGTYMTASLSSVEMERIAASMGRTVNLPIQRAEGKRAWDRMMVGSTLAG